MKIDSINIKVIENGYLVDIATDAKNPEDRWDTNDENFYCETWAEVIAKVTENQI
ncbi:hypothetical protein LCGC14_0615230 [marine sediment metagenome]|uniref:Uncharacterized protein n=1 Tax=marine sediment metagenome TaxID=412755 RepID=A0A0F9UEX3_9ZZZZ